MPLSPESLFVTLGLGWGWDGSAKKALKMKADSQEAPGLWQSLDEGWSAYGLHPRCLPSGATLLHQDDGLSLRLVHCLALLKMDLTSCPPPLRGGTLNKTDGFLPARIFRFFTEVDAIVNL